MFAWRTKIAKFFEQGKKVPKESCLKNDTNFNIINQLGEGLNYKLNPRQSLAKRL